MCAGNCNGCCDCSGICLPKGPKGDQGEPGTPYVAPVLVNEYFENVEYVSVGASATPTVYSFPSVGYQTLSYTNTSGGDLVLEVNATWKSGQTTILGASEQVDAAIIRTTVAPADVIEWEYLVTTAVAYTLREDATITEVGSGTTETVIASPGGGDIYLAKNFTEVPSIGAMFKKVTLLDGETISLKFKTKNTSSEDFITKAQFYVKELF